MLAGGWVSALLFRRCAMASLKELFSISVKSTPGPHGSRVVPLPSAVRQELCIVSVLAPLLASNLAPFCPKIPFGCFPEEGGLRRDVGVTGGICCCVACC